jgi:DNA segregation ATPase FtsK/SpoIIIE-like protein
MIKEHNENQHDDVRYFCDNVNIGYTEDVFMLRLASGDSIFSFMLTPEHIKRLTLALTHHMERYEKTHRRVTTDWPIRIKSPFSSGDFPLAPQKIDALYPKALALVVLRQEVSLKLLVENFTIDAERAQKLIELLQTQRVISAPLSGTKNRRVLIPREKPARRKNRKG